MTLNGHYALCFETRASFGAQHENLNEDRPILSATNMYRPMTLDSGNIRFMPMLAVAVVLKICVKIFLDLHMPVSVYYEYSTWRSVHLCCVIRSAF